MKTERKGFVPLVVTIETEHEQTVIKDAIQAGLTALATNRRYVMSNLSLEEQLLAQFLRALRE